MARFLEISGSEPSEGQPPAVCSAPVPSHDRPEKITEPLKFTTMNDSVKEKAEKVKRKIDAGIDRTAEKISDVSDSVQQHATHVKHAVKEKVARAADSVKEKAQHISDSMRETK